MVSNSQNHAANAARFLKCVWPFYDIAKLNGETSFFVKGYYVEKMCKQVRET